MGSTKTGMEAGEVGRVDGIRVLVSDIINKLSRERSDGYHAVSSYAGESTEGAEATK